MLTVNIDFAFMRWSVVFVSDHCVKETTEEIATQAYTEFQMPFK